MTFNSYSYEKSLKSGVLICIMCIMYDKQTFAQMLNFVYIQVHFLIYGMYIYVYIHFR